MKKDDVRSFLLHHYNWSNIRFLGSYDLPSLWVAITLLPIIFSFVYFFYSHFEAFSQGVFDINEGVVVDSVAFLIKYSPHESKSCLSSYTTWQFSAQVLYFSSLFFLFAKILHKRCPYVVMTRRKEHADEMRRIAAKSSVENLEIEKQNAICFIEEYEKVFNKKIVGLGNLMYDSEEVERLKAIEVGRLAEYDLLSTSNIVSLFFSSILYLFSFILFAVVLIIRTYVMIRGFG